MTSEILSVGRKKKDFLLIVLLGFMIYFSDDTILFGTNIDKKYLIIKYFVYLIITLAFFLKIKKNSLRAINIFYLCVIALSIILTAVTNFDFSGGYIYQVWIVFLAFLVTDILDFRSFADIFTRYVLVLSFFSIFIYIIANNYIWILGYFPVGENTAGVEYVNLYMGSVYKDVGEIRNAGIFREPGVFAIYILLAMIFELFLSEKISIKLIICLSVALATTFSTAAFLIIPFVLIGYMFKGDASGLKLNVFLASVFLVVACLFVILQPDQYINVFSKLEGDSASFGSSIARIASVVVNYEIFANHPLFGSGLGDYGNWFEKYSEIYFGVPLDAAGQSTNSFMSIFATYGIAHGLIVFFGVMHLSGKLSSRFIVKSILFFSFALMFSSQDMRYSVLFYILIFYGLRNHLGFTYRTG